MQNTKESRREMARIVGKAFASTLKDIEVDIPPSPTGATAQPHWRHHPAPIGATGGA